VKIRVIPDLHDRHALLAESLTRKQCGELTWATGGQLLCEARRALVADCKLVSESSLKLQHLQGARLLHSRNCPRCSSAVLGWPGAKQPMPNKIITFFQENLCARATNRRVDTMSPTTVTLSIFCFNFCFNLSILILVELPPCRGPELSIL
jgi:hypothetical protein